MLQFCWRNWRFDIVWAVLYFGLVYSLFPPCGIYGEILLLLIGVILGAVGVIGAGRDLGCGHVIDMMNTGIETDMIVDADIVRDLTPVRALVIPGIAEIDIEARTVLLVVNRL